MKVMSTIDGIRREVTLRELLGANIPEETYEDFAFKSVRGFLRAKGLEIVVEKRRQGNEHEKG